MSITSAIVLFAVCWFLTFLVVLPLRLQTQGEAGAVVPGTHKSAPVNPQIAKRAKITTGVAAVMWAILMGIILSGVISIRDIDWFDRMGPQAVPALVPDASPEG